MRRIDGDALIEFIENRYVITWKDDYEGGIKDACTDILEKISKMPTIEPERKTGWWMIREGISDAQCSECKMYFRDVYDMDNSDAFCRQCGTKMEGLKVVEDE